MGILTDREEFFCVDDLRVRVTIQVSAKSNLVPDRDRVLRAFDLASDIAAASRIAAKVEPWTRVGS